MGKWSEYTFLQRKYTNDKHIKMFNIIVEMQIKIMTYHFRPTRMNLIQKMAKMWEKWNFDILVEL